MRIYVASSWKNEKKCLLLARVLRNWGHEVDCFCDASSGRYVFSYAELGDVSKLDAVSALEEPKVVRAFGREVHREHLRRLMGTLVDSVRAATACCALRSGRAGGQ